MAKSKQGISELEKELERLQAILKEEKEKRQKAELELRKSKEFSTSHLDPEKQFLANMSHEIRNPINAIVGLINLLYDTKLSPEQFEYVNNIKYSADVLMSLIADILDLSKIESGNIELNERVIDITEVIKAVVQTYTFKTHDHDLNFAINLDDNLRGFYRADPTVINQIFLNLISNAVKFTEKGTIKISARLLEADEKIITAEFEIEDMGIGIPKSQLSTIFEAFKQGGLETKLKYGGTGLGLSIVKRLISLYDGEISVRSTEGKGSTFTFTLCLKQVDNENLIIPEAQHMPEGEVSLDRVLIVEDNKINQQYLTWLLEKWSIQYDVAGNGREALELTERSKYDLILMDIRMPVMDGYETTIRLRNQSINPNQNVPIIALTASALVDEQAKALEVGMNYHLPKPFSPDQLREMLNKLDLKEKGTFVEPDRPLDQISYGYQFSNTLNTDYLNSFYGDDIERAGLMFNIFLKNIDAELKRLRDYYSAMDIESFTSLAHKIKPNFAMVGLPEYAESMKDLEIIGKNEDFSRLEKKLSKFLADFEDKKSDIVNELERINNYLRS
ncbi:MAG: response regulator [Bacteroidota bacterium]